MKFNIKDYLGQLVILPISLLLMMIIITAYSIYDFIHNQHTIQLFFKMKKIFKIFIVIMGICIYTSMFSRIISCLRTGIPLFFERNAQTQVLTGTVEKTQKIWGHLYKFTEYNSYAYFVTINNKKYYFMEKAGVKVGDNVEIVYLPKSKVVLEVKFIDS